jgi:hypothetical protein
MRLTGTGVLALAALAAVGVLGLLMWRNPQWLNPASDKNLAYQAASDVASTIAGREETFGGLLRSWFSDDDEKITAMLKGSPSTSSRGGGKVVVLPLPNPRDAR